MPEETGLYPLKFQPILQYRIWGGEKLKTHFNKDSEQEKVGESWEISSVEGNETTVLEGPFSDLTLKELIRQFRGEILGAKVFDRFGEQFPLLVKIIDAKTPLSIQVHPGDLKAKERHGSMGKNEMWYVMQAEEGAELVMGFNKEISRSEYEGHIQNNTLEKIVNHEKVKSGDSFFIRSGFIHAIGAGVVLAEIQQSSDITYRLYDYDRVDIKTGLKRELHNDLALDVIDFNTDVESKLDYEEVLNESVNLLESNYFTTNIINMDSNVHRDYSNLDSFVIYLCVSGNLSISCQDKKYELKTGESIFIPAVINDIILETKDAKVLEVFID